MFTLKPSYTIFVVTIHQTELNENEAMIPELVVQLFATPHTETQLFLLHFCQLFSEFLLSKRVCIYKCWQKKCTHIYFLKKRKRYTHIYNYTRDTFKLYSRPTSKFILSNTEN